MGAGALAVLLTGAALLAFWLSGDGLKQGVQSRASQALGMDVVALGAVRLHLLPRPHIALADVQIRHQGGKFMSVGQAMLGVDLLPLLSLGVQINRIDLLHVSISLEQQRDGRFNLETLTKPGATLEPVGIRTIVLSDTALLYTDIHTGRSVAARACTMALRDVQISGPTSAPGAKRFSFSGELACQQLQSAGLVLEDLKSTVAANDGLVNFEPVTARAFGGQASGSLRADFSSQVPVFRFQGGLANFQLAQAVQGLSPRSLGEGSMNFSATLTLQGTSPQEMRRSLSGEVALSGHDLSLAIGDVDQAFSRYQASQSFNLVDVGAMFFAGPLGLVVTKGVSLASNLKESGGSSRVRTLVSLWHVEHGVAKAKDVAMATAENRVALKGELDVDAGRFRNVTVALLDAQGCASVQQKISGTFEQPVIEKPNVLLTLSGPMRNLLSRTARALGTRCEVFYAGSVAAPG